MQRILLAAVLLSSSIATARTVTLRTDDGVRLQADWNPPKHKKNPVIVAFHMYRNDRTSWNSLQSVATAAGFGFLAVDMRGHGKSAKQGKHDWSTRVKKRDKTLFGQLHEDVNAALSFVRKKRIGDSNIVLIGASVGCSAIIQHAATSTRFAAAILLSPGTRYLGIPSLKHIERWGDRPLLFVAPSDEVESGANPLYKAMGHHRRGIVLSVPQKKAHGTRMFGKVPRLEERLVEWAKMRVSEARKKPTKKKVTAPKSRKLPGL